MKLVVLLISLGFFVLVDGSENITISPIRSNANYSSEFLQKAAVNWTDGHSKVRLERMRGNWHAKSKTVMPISSTTTTTTTSTTTSAPVYGAPTYFPNGGDRIKLADCFYHRVWERNDESDLSTKQLFCKRLAENQPNEAEKYPKDKLNRFPTYLYLWKLLTNEKPALANYVLQFNLTSWKYNVTVDEKGEIEDCFFYRSWQLASIRSYNLSSHEQFCMRLSTSSPNEIEVREIHSFHEYRDIWTSMPEIARKDYDEIVKCFPLKGKAKRKRRANECGHYFHLIDSPLSWRDIRRKEVHECMKAKKQKGDRKSQCLETIRDYKRFYFQL